MTKKNKIKVVAREMNECPICYEDTNRTDSTTNLLLKKLSCGHIYHRSCIIAWMKRSKDCPMCRTSIGMSIFDRIFDFLVSCN